MAMEMDWGDIAKIGGTVLDNIWGDDDGGGDKKTTNITPVQPSTTGRAAMSDFDIMYSQSALESMNKFTDKVGEWAQTDRNFFENVYQPFQERVAQTNATILPYLSATTTATLEQNAKDLMKNDTLKNFLRNKAQVGDTGMDVALRAFEDHIAKVPDEQTRVGQALASVEQQFGDIGKQLTRDFASRGQTVSQASKRDLAMEKAKAKAGAADAAAEKARGEKGAALQAGLEANIGVNEASAAQRAKDVASLTSLQEAQQAGLSTPQVEGLTERQGYEGAGLQAGLETTQSTQEFGTRKREDTVTQVQKGIENPVLTSGATGQVPQGAMVQGEPARDATGALITPGSAGAKLKSGADAVGVATNAMTGVISGILNPH
jgi:hypothetical protein